MKKYHSPFPFFFRITAIILSVLTVTMSLPMSIIAEDILSIFDGDNLSSVIEQPVSGIFEDTDLRSSNTKTIRLSDGSFYLASYNTDVHRLTDDGTYADIDNTLLNTGEGIINADNTVLLPSNIKSNTPVLSVYSSDKSHEKYVSFRLLGNVNSSKGTITNPETKYGENTTELEKFTTLNKITSSVKYKDVFGNTDLEYVLNGSDIKENIIVKDRDKEYVYSFVMSFSGYTAEICETGEIYVIDSESGEKAYTIPSPVMWDNSGDTSSDISVNLKIADPSDYDLQGNETVYILTYTASSDWINDSSRVFPVTIDPPLYSSSSNIIDTYVSSAYPNTSYSSSTTLLVNTVNYVYLKINTLPTIPSLAYITDATITLENNDCTCTGIIGVYDVNTAWDTTLTWNGATSNYSDAPVDYVRMPYDREGYDEVYSSFPDGSYTWSILSLARKWYDGENYGLMLAPVNSSFSGTALFYSNDYSTPSSRPFLTVTYKNLTGVEDYLTYSGFSAGLAGDAYVNNATGNLVVSIPTLTTTDSLIPVTPTLVYNYNLNFADYKYSANGIQTANTYSYTAKSFKLNINETLIKKYFTDSTGTNVYYYILSDSDGTEHYFYHTGSDDEAYVEYYEDEDGLGLTLGEYYEGDLHCEIEDKNHNTKYYSQCGCPTGVSDAYLLTSIADKNGNRAEINTGTNNRPESIDLVPYTACEDDETYIQQLRFLYNTSGKLYCVYNPTSGQGVIFRYSNTYSGSIGTGYGNYLRQVVRAHGSTSYSGWETFYNTNSNTSTSVITVDSVSSYNYNYLGLMSKMTDELSGQRLNFYTYSSKKISTVYESETVGSTSGQAVLFEYGTDYTTLRSSGKDDVFNTSDDILTYYAFDKACRCVSSYSTDVNGKIAYGIDTAEYVDKEDNEKAVNSLKAAGYASDIAPNLLLNPTFEINGSSSTLHWTESSNQGVTFDSAAELYNQSLYDTDYNVKLSAKTTETFISQNVSLSSGTYTLSADVMHFWDADIDARLQVLSTSDGTVLAEEELSFRTEYDVPENAMTSVSFTVPSDNYTAAVKICISAKSSPSADDYILVRQLSLTKALGTGLVSKIEYGSFEDHDTESSTVTSKWTANSTNTYTLVTDPDGIFEGQSLCMTGIGINNTEYTVAQTLFTATSADYTHYCNTSNQTIQSKQYRISARVKSLNTIANENSTFDVRLVFVTKDRSGNLYTYPMPVEANKYTDSWQYLCGIVNSPDNEFVQEIRLECTYTNQVGTAYFDDISVCFVGIDENNASYGYNEDGNIEYAKSGAYTTWYVYGDGSNNAGKNDVSVIIKPRYATVYTYGSSHTVTQETVYTYTTDYDEYRYGWDADTISNNTTASLLSTTTYTHNAYGLQTQAMTVSGSQRLLTTQTYNLSLTVNSHIFGSVSSVTDDSGNTSYYYYYADTGALKAVVDALGNGIKYTYDGMGRITEAALCINNSALDFPYVSGSADVQYTYTGSNLSGISTTSTDYYVDYDSFGNMESVSIGNSGQAALADYVYNSNDGKLIQINYSNGQKIKYIYDALDRISEIQYNSNGGSTFTTAYKYTYDANGNLYCTEDLIGDTETYCKYDHNGKLIEYVATVPSGTGNDISESNYIVFYDSEGRTKTRLGYRDYLSSGVKYEDSYNISYAYDTTDGYLTSGNISCSDCEYNISYFHDNFGRTTFICTDLVQGEAYAEISTSIGYATLDSYSGTTSTRIGTVNITYPGNNGSDNYSYTYDACGNITEIRINNVLRYSYKYDSLGQLTRENNADTGKTVIYHYDTAGNITQKEIYSYTTSATVSGTPIDTVDYTYDCVEGYTNNYFEGLWGDLLTEYDGQEICYDNTGNPVSIGDDTTLTWTQGRKLASYEISDELSVLYKYNSDGIRTQKTVDGVTHYYTLDGSSILSEEWTICTNGNSVQHLMIYIYDASGSPVGFRYRNSTESSGVFHDYIYGKNIQGDILYIFGEDGTKYATYTYDAWGNLSVTYTNTGTNYSNAPGVQYNPFTYRGYYYDSETGLYYLNSRYYNPEVGRFINADSQLNPGTGLIGLNLYAYCNNNPVINIDPNGNFFISTTVICIVGFALVGAAVGSCGGYAFAKNNDIADEDTWKYIAGGATLGAVAGATLGAIAAPAVTAATGIAGINLSISAGITVVGTSGSVATEGVYYQVTSYEAAKSITNSSKLIPSASEGSVCVLDFQPTLQQAQDLGARSLDTVIRFETHCQTLVPDPGNIAGAMRNSIDGIIRVFNVTEVGFK